MENEKKAETSARPFEPTRIWNRKFVTILFIYLMVMMGNYMMRPIISNYALSLGASLSVAGVVAGMAFAVATVLRPVSGYLGDRLNKKTSLVIALAAFCVSTYGCALSENIVLVGACCAVQGLALSFQAIGLTSLATLCVPRARIGTAVGWMGIIMTITMAFGPWITSSIAALAGYRASFLLGGVLCTIGLVTTVLFKAPPGAEGRKDIVGDEGASKLKAIVGKAFHLPTVPIAIAGMLALWAPSSISMLLLTVEDTGYLTGAAWYFVVNAAVSLGARPLAGWLSDRTRSAIIAPPLLMLGVIGMIVLINGRDLTSIVICGALMGLGPSSAISVIQAESVRGVDVEHLGRATNTYYLGIDMGGALGAWVGGFLMQLGTPTLMFGFDAFTFVVAAVVVLLAHFARKRRRAQR